MFRPTIVVCLVMAVVACTRDEHGLPTTNDSALLQYRFELVGRGRAYMSAIAEYRFPPRAYIADRTPSINDRGDVAIDLEALSPTRIWKNGEVIGVANTHAGDPISSRTATSINTHGDVAFSVATIGDEKGDGIWLFNASDHQMTLLSSEPFGAFPWAHPRLMDDRSVAFKSFKGSDDATAIAMLPAGSDPDRLITLAASASMHPTSLYARIGTPSFDRFGHAAARVALVSGGTEIRVFRRGEPDVVVAQDRDANPDSGIRGFDDGVALDDVGRVAFIANVNGRRGVYRTGDGGTTRIATEGMNGVLELTYRRPVIGGDGEVAFQGVGTGRRESIWVGDGRTLKTVVTAGDVLPSDLGDALALPEITEFAPDGLVIFRGGIAMNALGDIAFTASLVQSADSGQRINLGTGLFVAHRSRPSPDGGTTR
jgi:hypothetical protein